MKHILNILIGLMVVVLVGSWLMYLNTQYGVHPLQGLIATYIGACGLWLCWLIGYKIREHISLKD